MTTPADAAPGGLTTAEAATRLAEPGLGGLPVLALHLLLRRWTGI